MTLTIFLLISIVVTFLNFALVLIVRRFSVEGKKTLKKMDSDERTILVHMTFFPMFNICVSIGLIALLIHPYLQMTTRKLLIKLKN